MILKKSINKTPVEWAVCDAIIREMGGFHVMSTLPGYPWMKLFKALKCFKPSQSSTRIKRLCEQYLQPFHESEADDHEEDREAGHREDESHDPMWIQTEEEMDRSDGRDLSLGERVDQELTKLKAAIGTYMHSMQPDKVVWHDDDCDFGMLNHLMSAINAHLAMPKDDPRCSPKPSCI